MFWLFLTGCCRNPVDPILNAPYETTAPAGDSIVIPIEEMIVDSTLSIDELIIRAESNSQDVSIETTKTDLIISSDLDTDATITFTAIDKCDTEASLRFDVTFGAGTIEDGECGKTFTYTPQGQVNGVSVAGEFSDWEPIELEELDDGSYQVDLSIAKGAYAYKFIEHSSNANNWVCDPNADMYQCDEGTGWQPDCISGQVTCNSVLRVADCQTARLELTNLEHDGDSLRFSAIGLDGSVSTVQVELNGNAIDSDWSDNTLELTIDDLPTGRNLITLTPFNADNQTGQVLNIPIWNDDFELDNATMYFAFVDRFNNGDASNDNPYGANWETGDYLGGDWKGLINKLDYLESLGVDILWLTAPWDNADGIFEGDCNMTITGYHGYWPKSPTQLEPQFGDEDTLRELIESAHSRHMRVLVDWVGNHVHEDHPYAIDNPTWFTDYHLCRENDNWNQAPETCWFAPYLPTLRYYQTAPIERMVEDAIQFAKDYNIDGFRVDAVKHIPHAVHHNFQTRIEEEIEHKDVGGSFEFYTVGETFSGDRGLLASYVSDTMLDGQFEFGNYWAILSAFARNETPLYQAEADVQSSLEFYGGAAMSHFLGNHDVERFISHAAGEVGSLYGDGLCPADTWRGPATSPSYYEPYARLRLAWVYLLSIEGPALIYYGDEIGLPGYHDPDNRQMMTFDLNEDQAGTLDIVQSMGQIRHDYPELTQGDRIIWWGETDDDVLAIARHSNSGESLVIINRSWSSRTISNGLSWAGLSDGNWNDVLNGGSFNASNDSLTIELPPMTARVLIKD